MKAARLSDVWSVCVVPTSSGRSRRLAWNLCAAVLHGCHGWRFTAPAPFPGVPRSYARVTLTVNV